MAEDTIKDEEYAPITQELRDYMRMRRLSPSEVVLSYCDNIDALHKSLEEQNAKLHEKVLNQRKQLAEVQEAIERRNNGVLKRRWQKKMDALKNENEEMHNFNYRVREAIKRHEDLTLWGADYTALPLDADGVPVHVGDKMVWRSLYGNREIVRVVTGISNIDFFAYDADRHETVRCVSADYSHYHEPTVEDVLRELWDESHNELLSYSPSDRDAIIMRYAKRLQLADGDAE